MERNLSNLRVLVVAMGRINASDSANNGLFLRNLFDQSLTRENLAQIYSGGDNGDAGFFGHYYKLKECDRRFGSFFFKLKRNSVTLSPAIAVKENHVFPVKGIRRFKDFVSRMIIDTGLYELIFKPRISRDMERWIQDFRPDIILAQGYNLTFTWLPVLIKSKVSARLVFLTTDDWPTYLYSGQLGEPTLFRWIVRPAVKIATHRLLKTVDVPIAFGQPMAEEFCSRYGKNFLSVNHSDCQLRFDKCEMHRVHPSHVITIMAIGSCNRFRWPLLIDVNNACEELQNKGINARLVVLSSAIEAEGLAALTLASYVDILPDPGNDLLPSYLKGADILLLAEGFDEKFVSAIKLSISSKAHLFMFSHRPILVYSHPKTGIAEYAKAYGWAKLITRRSKHDLAEAIQQLVEDKMEARALIVRADEIALKFHLHKKNREILSKGLVSSESSVE